MMDRATLQKLEVGEAGASWTWIGDRGVPGVAPPAPAPGIPVEVSEAAAV